ncbi:MAG: DNA-binding response regulator [Candidatus Margulisbacteria bacterium GWF2_35_9]|nr:MAG: DNA-binding response regulator [Candidatus Margulisbacteria bacterium GWF2_35_9]
MRKILIVDDEKDIVELIKYNLIKSSYETIVAYDGKDAIKLIEKNKPDLILLDWMLPGMDGIEVCKHVKGNRELNHIPIIMVSAKGEEFDKVLAFEIGADDYVPKPFSMKELLARIKAHLRRNNQLASDADLMVFDDLIIDKTKYEASIKQIPLNLTKTEFDLLHSMANNPSRVYSREQLLSKVWGDDFYGDDRVVDVHIRRLRSKIETKTDWEYVKTVRGVGYKFHIK